MARIRSLRSTDLSPRRGLTVVELMIAITISLIILAAMMAAFRRASNEIARGRATMSLASQMRAAGEMFRRDMANATVSPRVWCLTAECSGYFEVVEGPRTDDTYPALARANPANPDFSFLGDTPGANGADPGDVIALTVRSDDVPFRGRWIDGGGNTQVVESHLAEVIWFAVHDPVDDADNLIDLDDRVTLYRRVLLIRPDLALTGAAGNMDAYFAANDISARPLGGQIIANSLADLTRREYRFAHNAAIFPHELQPNWLVTRRLASGEDIVLTDVAGFDLRLFSPNAPVKADGRHWLEPNEANYVSVVGAPVSQGAYVDPAWFAGAGDGSWFSEAPHVPSTSAAWTYATWCNWSPHYEYDGIDQDGVMGIDQGTDGLDSDGDGVVDEEDERETFPPYAQPIRGIRLTLRAIEKTTSSVRQLTITSNFVPE